MLNQKASNSKMAKRVDERQKLNCMDGTGLSELFLVATHFSDFIKGEIVSVHRQVGEPWMVQSHFDILQHLTYGDLTMSQLSDKVGRTKPTITTLVKRLRNSGYVITYRTPEDERIHRVRITEKGQGQAEWAKKKLSTYGETVSGKVELSQIKDTIQLMESIERALIEAKIRE